MSDRSLAPLIGETPRPSWLRSALLGLGLVVAYAVRRISQGGEFTSRHLILVAIFFLAGAAVTWAWQRYRGQVWPWWLEGMVIAFAGLCLMFAAAGVLSGYL